MSRGRKPTMKFPVRSLQNVAYQPKKGYFEIQGRTKERTLTVSTVKTFAQTLRMMALSKQPVDTDNIATKRAKDALKNDPFVLHHKPWQLALKQMVKMGVRAEQQALAKHGLNYVIEKYLPQKIRKSAQFLP